MFDFSVIIPAKNEGKYLDQCLKSLIEQDFPKERYEIIVVDNGSDDDTVSIAHSRGVKVVSLPEAQTISAVRNSGVLEASGDVLVFLDADCTVASDWLLRAELYLDRDDVACFGSSPVIPGQATWVEEAWFLVRQSKEQVFERQWQESTNMFVHKKFFNKVGGFNEKLSTCEDVDLSYRLLPLGKIISDANIVTIHHRDPKSIKAFFYKEKWRGKDNYSGLVQHGIKLRELPSLLLPLYFTILILSSFGTMILGFPFVLTFSLLALAQLPVVGLTWLKIRHHFSFKNFVQLLLLYNVYFFARAMAIF
ncbi:MAG: glycosyl transferase [Desulfotalea sp.]|nr:MAG: glycosyl transferase [Desulfotalea sp.]